MGNAQRMVHFTPTFANKLMVGKLLEMDSGNGRRSLKGAVQFVPVRFEDLPEVGKTIRVLMWGSGTKHQASYFLDRPENGRAKASVDAHFDFQGLMGKNGLTPVEATYEALTCANHLVFTRLSGTEVRIIVPRSEIAGNMKAMERISEKIAIGTCAPYDEKEIGKVMSYFSLIGIEQAQDGALAGVGHLTVDLDAVKCFPAVPKWVLPADRGFSMEQVLGVIRRLRQNGETVFDFGGLMNSIPEFEVVSLPPGVVPEFSETEIAVKIAQDGIGTQVQRAGQDIVNRVYTYALNCYEAFIRTYFGLE